MLSILRVIAISQFLLISILLNSQEHFYRESNSEFQINFIQHTNTSDGGYFLVGNGFPSNADSTMALLYKFDQNSDLQWIKRYKVYSNDDFFSIQPTEDGNYMITGAFRQEFNLNNGGGYYIVDEEGVVVEFKQFPDSYDDRMTKVIQSNGSYSCLIRKGVSNQASKFLRLNAQGILMYTMEFYLGASGFLVDNMAWNGDDTYFILGNKYDAELEYSRGIIAAFDEDGIIWQHMLDPGEGMLPQQLFYDETDNSVYLTGNFNGTGPFLNPDFGVIKFSAEGNLLWSNRYLISTEEWDFHYYSHWMNDHLFLSGSFGLLPDNYGMMFEVGTDGSVLQSSAFNSSEYFTGFFYILGFLTDGTILGTSGAEDNVNRSLMKLNMDGQYYCGSSVPEIQTIAQSIQLSTPDISMEAIDLQTASPVPEVSEVNFEFLELCSGFLSTDEINLNAELELYPNPATDQLQFSDIEPGTRLFIYNQVGQLMKMQSVTASNGTIDLDDFAEGLYLFKFVNGSDAQVKKVQILK